MNVSIVPVGDLFSSFSGALRDSRRTSSTSSSSSGPPWWASVRPSIVDSRRMSARSDWCSDSDRTPADAATDSDAAEPVERSAAG